MEEEPAPRVSLGHMDEDRPVGKEEEKCEGSTFHYEERRDEP